MENYVKLFLSCVSFYLLFAPDLALLYALYAKNTVFITLLTFNLCLREASEERIHSH